MGRIIFCTGGCRSGKSAHAFSLANAYAGNKIFLATLEGRDAEMLERIRRHQAERSRGGEGWSTLEIRTEEALALPHILSGAPHGALLLDCLSTWVSACLETLSLNLSGLDRAGREEMILAVLAESLGRLAESNHPAIVVSLEVGFGLVPQSAEARLFRDILGRVNQLAASRAAEAHFVVSGIPLRLK